MYRSLSLYPTSADPAMVEVVVQRIAQAFRASAGFRGLTTSVDALMGPGAKAGQWARVVTADFDTLEDALNALDAEQFHDIRAASELLGPTHYLFECREL